MKFIENEPHPDMRRASSNGRIFDLSDTVVGNLWFSGHTKLGGGSKTPDEHPITLIPGSVVVCEITEQGRMLVTRVAGSGATYRKKSAE